MSRTPAVVSTEACDATVEGGLDPQPSAALYIETSSGPRADIAVARDAATDRPVEADVPAATTTSTEVLVDVGWVLARDADNVLRGRFSSTAAQSVGVVEIRR